MKNNYYGLTKEKVSESRAKHGKNSVNIDKNAPKFSILMGQFKDPILLMLLVFALVTLFMYTLDNSNIGLIQVYLICIILLINILLGFLQELRTIKSLDSLSELNRFISSVFRDGELTKIDSVDVVVDDVMYFELGEIIKADIKLIQCHDLIVDESFLTGESDPQLKKRGDIIYANSQILNGQGVGTVFAIGESTAIGQVAKTLSGRIKLKSYLEKTLKNLSTDLMLQALSVGIILAIILLVLGTPILLSFEIMLTMIISIVPVGLPTVLAIVFSVIARKSAKNKALIKDVRLLETLGQVNIICTDKTGTLTENKMRVIKKVVNPDFIDREDLTKFIALPTSATSNAVHQNLIKENTSYLELIEEIPFNSDIKYSAMKVLDKRNQKYYAVKFGAPDMMLHNCTDNFAVVSRSMAVEGMRVIVSIFKEIDFDIDLKSTMADEDYRLIGVYGLKDPIKRNMSSTVRKMHDAGIDLVMITGDHVDTAKFIARELNIYDEDKHLALLGSDLDILSDEEVMQIIMKVRIYARVSAEQKERIIELFKKCGNVVAMLGDGTNDAIALSQANIGIAMGNTGTDVAKEAADLIILDDDFATINYGIISGRTIFNNIQKFIGQMLTINVANLIVILLVLLFTSGPIIPMSIVLFLWINLISDGLTALTLGFEQPEDKIMLELPKTNKTKILNRSLLSKVLIKGITLGILATIIFLVVNANQGYSMAVTATFVVLSFGQIFGSLEMRTLYKRANLKLTSNIAYLSAFFGAMIMNLVIIYSPASEVFGLFKLDYNLLFICILVSIIPTMVMVIVKPFFIKI